MRTAAITSSPSWPSPSPLPPSAARQDQDIVDTATAAGNFTTLTKLLKRAGLVTR